MFHWSRVSKRVHKTSDARTDGVSEGSERRAKMAADRLTDTSQYLPIEDNEMPA